MRMRSSGKKRESRSLAAVFVCAAVACAVAGAAGAEPPKAPAGGQGGQGRAKPAGPERLAGPIVLQGPQGDRLFEGVDLTPEQQKQLDDVKAEQKRWFAEHQAELDALRRKAAAARKAGNEKAAKAAQEKFIALRRQAPNASGLLHELSVEQRAKIEENSRNLGEGGARAGGDVEKRRAEMREHVSEFRSEQFQGVGLTPEQQKQIEELGKARRAWAEQHADELRALRERQRAAAKSGDTAAAEKARKEMQALRATAPDMSGVMSQLTDEQRAKLRANREKLVRTRAPQGSADEP